MFVCPPRSPFNRFVLVCPLVKRCSVGASLHSFPFPPFLWLPACSVCSPLCPHPPRALPRLSTGCPCAGFVPSSTTRAHPRSHAPPRLRSVDPATHSPPPHPCPLQAWIKFASLCRKAGRLELCRASLSKLLPPESLIATLPVHQVCMWWWVGVGFKCVWEGGGTREYKRRWKCQVASARFREGREERGLGA
jgi:hypothetical protein